MPVYRFFILLLLFSSCSFNRENLPEIPLSENYSFKNIETSEGELNPWWKQIDDPVFITWLNELKSNLQLKSATERVLQSRERLQQSRSGLLPEINLVGTPQRSRSNLSSFGAIADQIPGEGERNVKIYNTNYNLELQTNWQIDLFGKLRSANSLAEKNYLLSAAEKQALFNTLVADLFNLRVLLPNLYRQKVAQKQIIKNLKIKSKLFESRYKRGAGVSLELLQVAREELQQAKQSLIPLKLDLKRSRLALSVILGKEEYRIKLKELDLYEIPETLKIPQPLSILDGHPEVLADRFRVLAAEENVDVAIADLYPNLNLSFNYGYNSQTTTDFFSPENVVWRLVGSMATRIFSAGRLNSEVDIAESELRVVVNQYQEKVLRILNEVKLAYARDLAEYKSYQNQYILNQQNLALQDSQEYRYQRGAVGVESLLSSRIARERSVMQLLAQRLKSQQARVALYLSLGGNWQSPEEFQNENSLENKVKENG